MSNAKVDFPEPLTPVMTVRAFSGICMSRFLRLFCLAPRMWIKFSLMGGIGCLVGYSEVFETGALEWCSNGVMHLNPTLQYSNTPALRCARCSADPLHGHCRWYFSTKIRRKREP